MNRSQFGWSRALLLTAILAALGGIVGATIPDPSGVYHGCLKNGNLRVIDSATESCKQNETPITWNQTGPAGIQGPQGPQGIQGAQGLQGPAGTVALPAGRCWANRQRYVDCGNGTVTDQVTGLIWLKNSACLAPMDYAAANMAAQTLQAGQCGLTDGSVSGQWRLPTKDEWTATVSWVKTQGCVDPNGPTLTDNFGDQCYSAVPDGTGVHERALLGVPLGYPAYYWSGTVADFHPGSAFLAELAQGVITNGGPTIVVGVWPVRGVLY
jgi:hypothetical protein